MSDIEQPPKRKTVPRSLPPLNSRSSVSNPRRARTSSVARKQSNRRKEIETVEDDGVVRDEVDTGIELGHRQTPRGNSRTAAKQHRRPYLHAIFIANVLQSN